MQILKRGTVQLLSAGDRAQAGFWRWTLSFVVLCACGLGVIYVSGSLLSDEMYNTVMSEGYLKSRPEALATTLFFFSTLGLFIPAIAVALRVVRLNVAKIVSPLGRVSWRLVFKIALSSFLISSIAYLANLWSFASLEDIHFAPLPIWAWYYVPLIIVAVFFQATAEELLFRGYLLQLVGRWTRSWWIILTLVALPFFAAHLENPEVAIFGWFAYLDYALAALLFTLLALLTGRLEYSIGVHIGWNWMVLLIDVETISAPDLYTGLGPIVYTGSLEPTLLDAASVILVHVVLGLWCLSEHFSSSR